MRIHKHEEEAPKTNLIGFSPEDLEQELCTNLKAKKYQAKQIYTWIYHHGVISFDKMTNISKDLQAKLDEQYCIKRLDIIKEQKSIDGTVKWLLSTEDGNYIECVFIPERNRGGALCVSSQVGCQMGCKFCNTATQGFTRNLTPGEIISQVMQCRDYVQEWGKLDDSRTFSNIVMMGQGEPLYNYDNVVKSLKLMMDSKGISISKKRITISTCGIADKIVQLGKDTNVNLALSLHAPNDKKRHQIMPVSKQFSMEELMQAIKDYPSLSNQRRITFEYIMLAGINDSNEDAKELIDLLKGIPAKINLIGFNSWDGCGFKSSSNNRMHKFADILAAAGYSSPIRTPRGADIMAACGQLKSMTLKDKSK